MRSWLVVVVVGYVGSFVLLTMVLRAGMPVGVALIVAGVLTIEMGGAVN